MVIVISLTSFMSRVLKCLQCGLVSGVVEQSEMKVDSFDDKVPFRAKLLFLTLLIPSVNKYVLDKDGTMCLLCSFLTRYYNNTGGVALGHSGV